MSDQLSEFKEDEWPPITASEEKEWSDVIKAINAQDKNAIRKLMQRDARALGWSEEDIAKL